MCLQEDDNDERCGEHQGPGRYISGPNTGKTRILGGKVRNICFMLPGMFKATA